MTFQVILLSSYGLATKNNTAKNVSSLAEKTRIRAAYVAFLASSFFLTFFSNPIMCPHFFLVTRTRDYSIFFSLINTKFLKYNKMIYLYSFYI